MSIFSRIRDAIFHRDPPVSTGAPPATPSPDHPPTVATSNPVAAGSAPASANRPPVDVEAVLTKLAAENSPPLNWRSSIVDLMKLLGMESSLQERQELARELGYAGSTSDTATMNVWLHRQVMQKLADNGGKLPPDLMH